MLAPLTRRLSPQSFTMIHPPPLPPMPGSDVFRSPGGMAGCYDGFGVPCEPGKDGASGKAFPPRLPLTRSLAHSLLPSLTHSLACSLIHSHMHSLTRSLTHSLTQSFARSLARSLTHITGNLRCISPPNPFKGIS